MGWDRRTAPTWFASNCCVCFPWSEFDRSAADTTVEIDPGGGFGAGDHPTTLLLLQYLAEADRLGRVLDIGCGSGVLSIAAALLGAEKVVAVDISPAAVAATRANATRNGVNELVTVSDTPVSSVEGTFDAIVANIHAPVLVNMAKDLRRLLAPGGWLALSGLSKAQVSLTNTAFAPLAITHQRENNDWAALVLSRGATRA